MGGSDYQLGLLVHECLVSESSVRCEDSVWMKVWGERGRSALYIGCVYIPIDSKSIAKAGLKKMYVRT